MRLDWEALKLAYRLRPLEDRLVATIHDFDETGTYVNRVMKVGDVERFIRDEWDRQDPVMAVD
jgi:hypothetical protein